MLESIYKDLLTNYNVDLETTKDLWKEIKTNHSKSGRHYHNLDHLIDLHNQLIEVKDKIKNWNVILFTLFYHDVIYKSTKKDNEEQSGKLAIKRMTEIGVQESEINQCHQQILATKYHKENSDSDTNYFTDADLSILGREPNKYKDYCRKIRKEYSIYPNFLYNKGRKKVIEHFLSMPRIYKTEEFYNKYEKQAKQNLLEELNRY